MTSSYSKWLISDWRLHSIYCESCLFGCRWFWRLGLIFVCPYFCLQRHKICEIMGKQKLQVSQLCNCVMWNQHIWNALQLVINFLFFCYFSSGNPATKFSNTLDEIIWNSLIIILRILFGIPKLGHWLPNFSEMLNFVNFFQIFSMIAKI